MNESHQRTPAGLPRARSIGVPFDGRPGPHNAITDVEGVEVGYVTLIEGSGAMRVGHGPVRTGVTAILPRGKQDWGACAAGWHSFNGNGEMTGSHWCYGKRVTAARPVTRVANSDDRQGRFRCCCAGSLDKACQLFAAPVPK